MIEPLFLPVVRGWNRLEARPRTEDFGRSLRAEVRDPLWMLTRQWQYGEFRGEDAGSPVNADLLTQEIYLNRYSVRHQSAQPFEKDIPLEARVEREALAEDLAFKIRAGRYFFKLLNSKGLLNKSRSAYLAQYQIDPLPASTTDESSRQAAACATGRIIDGGKLLKAIRDGSHQVFVDTIAGLTADEQTALKTSIAALYADSLFGAFTRPSDKNDDAWAASQLEYQFSCSAEGAAGEQTVLVAEQYAEGHLDWYSFDIDARPEARLNDKEGAEPIAPVPVKETVLSFVPVPVSFGGMPLPRYWAMENRKTEFADIGAHTTDVAKLMLTEFALMYSDDWCIIPYEMQTGAIAQISGLVVTDVFGERTLIRAAGAGIDDDWKRWNMYGLSTNGAAADNRLFIPPTTFKLLESPPIEKVNFLRDEMANMVWAVEAVIPSPLGKGIDGYEAALEIENSEQPVLPALHTTPAKIRYILGTDVPYNWIPFIPVRLPGDNRQIQLQRARMPLQTGSRGFKGKILDVPSPYFVREEEVPRAGKIVSRSYQRCRWTDGKVVVWVGRRATTGKGEGTSGLAFDQVEEKSET